MAARKRRKSSSTKIICSRVKIKKGPRKGKTVLMCRKGGRGPLVKKPRGRK